MLGILLISPDFTGFLALKTIFIALLLKFEHFFVILPFGNISLLITNNLTEWQQ